MAEFEMRTIFQCNAWGYWFSANYQYLFKLYLVLRSKTVMPEHIKICAMVFLATIA